MTTTKPTNKATTKENNMTSTDTLNTIRTGQDWVASREGSRLTAAKRLATFGVQHGTIDVPTDLDTAARRVATCQQRQREAATTLAPPAFTAADLASNDWTDRLTSTAAATAGIHHVDQLCRAATDDALTELAAALPTAVREMTDQLEAWYIANISELARAGRQHPDETHRAADVRDDLARDFHNTHAAVMEAGAGRRGHDYRAEWWTTHRWTPKTWRELVDSTGPGMSYRDVDRLSLAQQIGAQPRLARSLEQPWNDFVAMMEGHHPEPAAQDDQHDTEADAAPMAGDDWLAKAATR